MAFIKILFALLLIQLTASARGTLNSKVKFDFTPAFLYRIFVENLERNILISPTAVQTSLTMAYMGASGQTSQELRQNLLFTKSKSEEIADQKKFWDSLTPLVKVGIRIFVHKTAPVKSEYNNQIINTFNLEAENLDFSKPEKSAYYINKWVASTTNNGIENIVTPNVVSHADMVLVNAVHFSGEWLHHFEYTERAEFWYGKEARNETDMMFQRNDFYFANVKDLDAKILQLQYRDTDLSMFIILPNTRNGILSLQKRIRHFDLEKAIPILTLTTVEVLLPKFEVKFNINLNGVLREMGMSRIFTNAAEFPHISVANSKVTQVVQKAVMKVDESGCNAKPVNFIVPSEDPFSKIIPHDEPEQFTANHPFMFLIKNNNGILFMGHIMIL